jgi:GNAT superfamily N-acetyltransferase
MPCARCYTGRVRIRETTEDDIPALDLIRTAVFPWHAIALATQRVWFAKSPPGSRPLRLVAEIDGRVVGLLETGLDPDAAVPGLATANLCVHPDARRRGVGSTLWERLVAHATEIGASRLQSNAMDDEESLAFATGRGFTAGSADRFQVVDPRVLPEQPPTPPGVRIVSAAESGPEPLYRVDDVAARDEPGDSPYTGLPFDRWCADYWEVMDREASMVAMVGSEPAAVTMLVGDRDKGRLTSSGSNTLREYRGRGLMKLVKSVSLRRAAELGITACFTSNDEVNAPMLAVNRWLGYRAVGGTRSIVKTLC